MTTELTAYADTKAMAQARRELVAFATESQASASGRMVELGQRVHEHVWLSIECDTDLVELGHSKGAFNQVVASLKAMLADARCDIDLTRAVKWYCLSEIVGDAASVARQSTQVLRRFERLLDFDGEGSFYFKPYSTEALTFAKRWLAKDGKARLTGETASEQLCKLDAERFPAPLAKEEKPKASAKEAPTVDDADDDSSDIADSSEPMTYIDVARNVKAWLAQASEDERRLLFVEMKGIIGAYTSEAKTAPKAQHKPAPQVAAVA